MDAMVWAVFGFIAKVPSSRPKPCATCNQLHFNLSIILSYKLCILMLSSQHTFHDSSYRMYNNCRDMSAP